MIEFMMFSHVSLVVSNLEESMKFYGDCIGLKPIERPHFDFPGAWYSLGGTLQLHLIVNKTAVKRDKPIKFDIKTPHFSLAVKSIDVVSQALSRIQIHFHQVATPDGVGQIFVADPDGNYVEFLEHSAGALRVAG